MRILHVSSEVAPFAQSGGLADVLAGLPHAQAELGLDVTVLVPLYRGVAERLAAAGHELGEPQPLPIAIGAHRIDAAVRFTEVGPARYAFLDCPALYDRDGGLYGPGGPAEFGDNHLRFGALGWAAVHGTAVLGPADVIHAHDWQGAPAVIFAHVAGEGAPRTVLTIHNLAFRGIFPKAVMTELGLPWSVFTAHELEFYDQVSFLKGALALAGAATTVSPTYAREILTPERGEALDGFLRHNVARVHGIVNGIDTEAWDPATDRALAAQFSIDDLSGRAICKAALIDEASLPQNPADAPLLGVIARFSDQKGLDLIADIAPDLGAFGARLIVLGSGEPALEWRFRYLAEAFADHVSVAIGFDGDYAHRIYAGCDLFVMPSRFEPCGLGQLYAMRYGALPIVHAVGGLRDTVIDFADDPIAGTGVRFDEATPSALLGAIERGLTLYRDRVAFAARQRVAMARDSSWTRSAREYIELYRSLAA